MIYAQPHWRRLTYGFAFLVLLGAAPKLRLKHCPWTPSTPSFNIAFVLMRVHRITAPVSMPAWRPRRLGIKTRHRIYQSRFRLWLFWNIGTRVRKTYICYQNEAVIPIAACNADSCLSIIRRNSVPMRWRRNTAVARRAVGLIGR